MSDFKRLLDDESTDATQAELIRFARREGPSSEGRAKILGALAAKTGLGLTALTSDASAAPPASSLPPPPVLHAASPFKWALIGLAAVGVPLAAWFVFKAAQPPPAAPAAPPPPAVVKPVEPEATAEPAQPAPAAAPAPRVEETPAVPAARAPKSAPSASSGSTLADEVKALGRAKAALSAGNPQQALRELDAYRAAFPAGKLGQEATVTRIEALVASGDRATAKRLGERFLSHSAKSPYAARVRSLIGE
jgi:outer membrane biosynthesis protein TonB